VAVFVTGIAQTQNRDELETMLGRLDGLDRSKFVLITTSEVTAEDDSILHLVNAAAKEDKIITNFGGTGVPGVDTSVTQLGALSHEHGAWHIGALPIPEDEAENYSDAIDDGRSVIAYTADNADTAAIETAFRNAGLAHVKTFRD
jgi:hypothetical protein